jgi:hypothetical protein
MTKTEIITFTVQYTYKLNHMPYRVHLTSAGFELTTLVVIGTDGIGSCKSNYHMITTTTAPSSSCVNCDIRGIFIFINLEVFTICNLPRFSYWWNCHSIKLNEKKPQYLSVMKINVAHKSDNGCKYFGRYRYCFFDIRGIFIFINLEVFTTCNYSPESIITFI